MAEMRKKVEISLGAFSCSIEGYDDPADEMRKILLLMRDIMHDAPSLSGQDAIDAVTMERLEGALDASVERLGHDGADGITIHTGAIHTGHGADLPESGSHGDPDNIFREAAASDLMPGESSIFAAPTASGNAQMRASMPNIFT